MLLEIPIPTTNIEVVWLLIGMSFGRSFGKKLDHTIQLTDFYQIQGPAAQWLIKAILDFTHHWWMGALIWLYASLIVNVLSWPTLLPEVLFFGVGIFFDDIRDFRHVLARYKNDTEEEPGNG